MQGGAEVPGILSGASCLGGELQSDSGNGINDPSVSFSLFHPGQLVSGADGKVSHPIKNSCLSAVRPDDVTSRSGLSRKDFRLNTKRYIFFSSQSKEAPILFKRGCRKFPPSPIILFTHSHLQGVNAYVCRTVTAIQPCLARARALRGLCRRMFLHACFDVEGGKACAISWRR